MLLLLVDKITARRIIEIKFVEQGQVHWGEWGDHIFFAIAFFYEFIVALCQFTDFLF